MAERTMAVAKVCPLEYVTSTGMGQVSAHAEGRISHAFLYELY